MSANAVDPRAHLQWVVVGGAPRHVSDFAMLEPSQRPRATCPECEQPLVLKLGRVLVHHAAHRADAAMCAATHPETALHINLKCHLAAQLAAAVGSGVPIRIAARCAEAPCSEHDVREWLAAGGWSEVRLEMRVGHGNGGRRPDIVVLDGTRPVAAIEVFVTHAVDAAKGEALAALRVPWIEVRADGALIAPETAWTVAQPLPSHREGPARPWRCSAHALVHAAHMEAARHTTHLRAARVVDVYRAGGARVRCLFRVVEHRLDDTATAVALLRDGLEVARVALAASDRVSRQAAWDALQQYYADALAAELSAGALFHDSPMRWVTGDNATRLVDEAPLDMVRGDATPLVSRYPRRYFYASARGEWFAPPEMRDARWDRDTDDAFAAHPAWTASRAAVRERSMGSGYTTEPVFAGRLRPEHMAELGANTLTTIVPGVLTVTLDAGEDSGRPPITLAAITMPLPPDEVRRIHALLSDAGALCVWLSRPSEWSLELAAEIPWAPAGTTGRGWPRVVVDKVGMFRLSEFARALIVGETRLSPAELVKRGRRRMEARLSG